MRSPVAAASLLLAAATSAAASSSSPQLVFSNPAGQHPFKIPTRYESTVLARRILRLESIGTLSTVFPKSSSSASSDDDLSALENRPDAVAGSPLGLMEYFGDCEPASGNPTMLAVTIASSYKNAAAGSNATLSFRWNPPPAYYRTPPAWTHNPANLPRVALTGYLEPISKADLAAAGVAQCFTRYHPEARIWSPGNDIHESWWARLVVREAYWFGGFGDRAWIGWFDMDEWRGVTEEEIAKARLPGEEADDAVPTIGKSRSRWWSWLEL
ncbi:MAG: hypothetical protein INR71_13065 [Terriglobus roseus]|nr:hypothetical protein [Terriglobus roseus]